MKANVGSIDQAVRIIVGLALIAATVVGAIGLWGWIGILPLATGLMGWCPPYALFGWSTCALKNKG